MKIIILSLLAFISFNAFAQSGSISGAVTDNLQQPLTGATILLLHLPDSVRVAGLPADINGSFRFNNVKNGSYTVKAAMVSYPAICSKTIEVSTTNINVPVIILSEAKTSLKEVTISATLPQLQQKSDRLVVNVEKLNTTGDNALDVLQKAPGIRLDKDDNILYRNNGGVNIMIDGRLTYMSGTELSNYLKSLPGNMISKIELIPNPPGTYDAEGNAGMINIILKRNKAQGYSGTVTANAAYGKYGKAYGGFNMNYNTSNWSFYTRINTGYYDSYNKLTLGRQIDDQEYNELNYWHPKSVSTSYVAGADYHIDKRQTFGIMLKGYNDPTNSAVTSQSETLNALGQQIGSVSGVGPQNTNTSTYSLNLNYTLAIDTSGQKFSMDADYINSASSEHDLYTNSYYDENGLITGIPAQLRNNSPVNYDIKSVKADYSLPLPEHLQFETGIKSSWVTTHSNVEFDSLKTAGWVSDPLYSNDFVYDENINAAYVTLDKTFNKQLDVKASLRAEQTISTTNSMYGTQIIDRNYLQWFPSAFVTYKINDDNQLNASASRRITRPNYGSLNSAIRYIDPYTAIQGNPYLQPAISQSYVLNYTYKSFQVLSLSYLKVDNAINKVIDQNDETKESLSSYENLGTTSTVTATSAGNFNVLKWWNVYVELDGEFDYVNTIVGSQPFVSRRFSWSGQIDQYFYLPNNLKLSLSSQYFSPSISGLARTLSGSQIDAGVSKTLLNKKLTLSFKARDIFFDNRYRSILQYNNVNTTWTNEWESRRFTLGMTYQFGNTKLKVAHNRQTGSSDEERRM